MIEMLRKVRRNAEESPVIDLLLRTPADLRVVLTVSKEYLSPEGEAYLLGGQFTAIGKCTAVLPSAGGINLFRRTVLGVMSSEDATGMIRSLREGETAFAKAIGDPVVTAPLLQLLPLAIFT